MTRRHFFYGALLAGAIERTTVSLKAAGYKSPNEKLNVASIGAGGRAASDIGGVAPTENIVALADPDDRNAANTFKNFEKATKYKDFRVMLDKQKDIDAVIIAIPDHMHACAAMWAMERGKHVYVEKPLTRTIWEARLLTEAAAKYKVATQMGNQGYSNEGARIACEIIWSGEIGNVTEVHAWTNRPIWPQGLTEIPAPEPPPATLDWDLWLGVAKDRPWTSGGAGGNRGFYNPFNWRGFYDFGCGALGDMACHILGAPNMALQLGAPSSVECLKKEGTSPFMFPKKSSTRFDFPARGAMPAVKLFWHDAQTGAAYKPQGVPDDEPLIGGAGAFGARGQAFTGGGAAGDAPAPTATPGNAPAGGRGGRGGRGGGGGGGGQTNGAVFVGEKGIVTTDTYANNVRLLPAARMKDYKLPPQYLTRSPGHYRDWIRACKGGAPACSNFAIAGPFTEWICLGVVATRVDGRLDWNSSQMKFTNSPEANKFVKPEIRKGWNIG
jgi:predicted dehydrogenase